VSDILQKSLAGLFPKDILNAISGPLTKLLLGAIYRNKDVLSEIDLHNEGANGIVINNPLTICLNATENPGNISIPIPNTSLVVDIHLEMLSDFQITLTPMTIHQLWLDYAGSKLLVGLNMSAPLFRMAGDFNWTLATTNTADSNVTFVSFILDESVWTMEDLYSLISLSLGPLMPVNSTLQVSDFFLEAGEENMSWPMKLTLIDHAATHYDGVKLDFADPFRNLIGLLWDLLLRPLVEGGINLLLRNCSLKDIFETGLACLISAESEADLAEGLAMYDALITLMGECPTFQLPTSTTPGPTTTTTPGTGETTTTTTTTPTTTTPSPTTPNSAQILTFWSFLPFITLLVYGAGV